MTTSAPIIDAIIADMTQRYISAQTTNTVPSMLELVAIGVQLVDRTNASPALTGSQKMEIVKQVVAGIVAQLPMPADIRAQLQAGLFVVENLAEVALSLLKANAMISTQVETTIKSCTPGWCPSCFKSDGVETTSAVATKPLSIPFPVIQY